MAIWYRASQLKNKQAVFSGEGGLYVAGKWNHRGRKVTYCSESISLCTLEWLAHNGLSVSGFNYYRYSIEIEDGLIFRLSAANLPRKWSITPATDITRDLADQYLFLSNKYLALAVPSVMIPEEFNLIMNPLHDAYTKALSTIKNLGQYLAPKR